jgi:hypothetical protein
MTVSARRFPPPWTVKELGACFVVRDANRQALGYFYFEDEPGRRSAAKLLTKDEAAADCCELCEVAGAVAEAVICRGRAEEDCRFAFPLLFWAVGPIGTLGKTRRLLRTMDCCNADKAELGKVCQISEL